MLFLEDSHCENWKSLVRKKYHLEIDRELLHLNNIEKINLQWLISCNYKKSKQPETEIKYFKFYQGNILI
jgi:hypothetical protein